MKRLITISVIIQLTMSGCGENRQSTDTLITIDVSASYPEKELRLQDFMDVEYIPLETSDEFITKDYVKAVGKDILLVTNLGSGGDIFVFDRATGKGIRKINRLGQSGEEYSQITDIILDEDNDEMFVKDYPARKLIAYDLEGNFKRSFKFADTGYYVESSDYDKDNLICYKGYLPSVENEQACFLLVSKQDGSITREIPIRSEKIETPVVTKEGAVVTPEFYLTVPYQENWILTKVSSDTIYSYLPDGTLRPFIARTPSIHTMDPQVFLFPGTITDRYSFMRALKKEFNFEKRKGFPTTDLVYDKQEKAIYEYSVYNDDFSNKKQVTLGAKPVNREIADCQSLGAPELVEAYGKGELKGRLKEIAAGLDEEANPVVMLIKHKN